MPIRLEDVLARRRPVPADVDLSCLDVALRDIMSEERYTPIDAITRVLLVIDPFRTLAGLALESAPGTSQRPLSLEDSSTLIRGYVALLATVRMALSADSAPELEPADVVARYTNDEALALLVRHLATRYMALARTLLDADPTGRVFASHIASGERHRDPQGLFAYGVEYAARLFAVHARVVDALLPDAIEGRPQAILPTLRRMGGTVPHARPADAGPSRLAMSAPNNSLPSRLEFVTELIERGTDENALSVELASLADDPELSRWTCVWSAVQLARGDQASREYARTGALSALGLAQSSFGRALHDEPLWTRDAGWERVAATKLGESMLQAGTEFLHPARDVARAVATAYLRFLEATERLYQRSFDRRTKQELQESTALAASRVLEAACFLAELPGEPATSWAQRAFSLADLCKSRILREQVALSRRRAPSDVPESIVAREQALLRSTRRIVAEAEGEATTHPLKMDRDRRARMVEERTEMRLALESIWAEMEGYGDDAAAYVTVRRDDAVYYRDVDWSANERTFERLGPNCLVVELFRLTDAVLVAAMRHGWARPRLYVVPLSKQEMRTFLEDYNRDIHERDMTADPWAPRPWQAMGDRLFSELREELDESEYLYLLPHGKLHLVALHALTVDGAPLIERRNVLYAPSLAILESTLSRGTASGPSLVIACPGSGDGDALRDAILGCAREAADRLTSVEAHFGCATRRQLRDKAPGARIIHFSGHGFYDSDPLLAGIWLSGGEPFFAQDWLGLTLSADLVTLGACLTGIVDVRGGDDAVGLVPAILFAGASSLVMTLAQVEATSTQRWMSAFYEALETERDKATAFREATISVRESHGDPAFWAPFVLIGSHR